MFHAIIPVFRQLASQLFLIREEHPCVVTEPAQDGSLLIKAVKDSRIAEKKFLKHLPICQIFASKRRHTVRTKKGNLLEKPCDDWGDLYRLHAALLF